MSLSKNVAFFVATRASKQNRLFGLSREDLKLVHGATGVIVNVPVEAPPVPASTDPTTTIPVVLPLPAPLVP